MLPPAETGRIVVLADALASKIAAGEVIERPASVVKELVENALDAGARRVRIDLEGGGVRLIRVADDGEGMRPEDAPLAFRRHATSKLRTEADLDDIRTLGFRGEALPSLAAVARVELVTRAAAMDVGVRVRAEQGAVVDVHETGAPPGTTVAVAELFASVPARRKFLKSPATELGRANDVLVRLALVTPGVHWRIVHEGRELNVYPPVATLAERARQVFGAERVRDGRAFGHERLGVRVEGFAFSPHLSFASARHVHVFVNGRAVRDRSLQHAIIEAYQSLIPRGRWPGCVVMLAMPPAEVDVNVHPAKHEVRFRHARVVHDAVLSALRRALADGPRAAPAAPASVAETLGRYLARAPEPTSLALGRPHLAASAAPATTAHTADAPRPVAGSGFAALRFVGQVFRGYLVCEGSERLVLVDQHAAHERIAFERLRAQHRAGAVERQTVLLPATIELPVGRAEAVAGRLEDFTALGFEIEPFGERTFLARAIPALLGATDPRLLLEDLAEGLSELGSRLPAVEAVDELLGRIACHSVVRVGRALAEPEVQRLLADLDALDYGTNCPHGRPVSVEFSRGQVERMFGR